MLIFDNKHDGSEMEIIGYMIGYLAGVTTGIVSTGNKPISQRYALFVTKNENEALQQVKEAYTHLYERPPEIVSFNEEGDLVKRIQKTGMFGNVKTIEEVDESISLDNFLEEHLLKVKLYDNDMDPISENIMLARYLIKKIKEE